LIPSILSSQLIKGTKGFLTTTFPSSTPAFFEMTDRFVNEEGKLFKGPYISVALPFKKGDAYADAPRTPSRCMLGHSAGVVSDS